MNFWKRYPGDYARDTAHLSLDQHGAFTLLLDHYYSTELPLSAELATLCRICRAFSETEQATVRWVADAFFPLAGDGLRHNERADRQIVKERKAIDSARENGKSGGRPLKSVHNQEHNPPETEIKSESKPEQNQLGLNIITGSKPASKAHPLPLLKEEARAKPIAHQAARFDEFWKCYPVRKGRLKAIAKWERWHLDDIADLIIADVKDRKVRDRQWLDGFAPHGATYINARGWEDDVEVVKPNGRDGKPVHGYVPMPGER